MLCYPLTTTVTSAQEAVILQGDLACPKWPIPRRCFSNRHWRVCITFILRVLSHSTGDKAYNSPPNMILRGRLHWLSPNYTRRALVSIYYSLASDVPLSGRVTACKLSPAQK
ncbi:hypothetical protein OBBRIDRAFT_233535 [Obba rivulosa]|uniref:Uncharacterized protein n=1 Tax=Obba rivulosa TaxID=1052685 RepID=A0A8E2DVJ6_9APHY|nr:hypothetical protein OBBRIDRAFT_233535 [Obba rivulosa]